MRAGRPTGVAATPKPADAVGGMGLGIVGGQTICGLRWLADLAERPDVAWWPFDGLKLNSPEFVGKHVGVEIYPSALRPRSVPQTDDNDAKHSVQYVHDADVAGMLPRLMDLSSLTPQAAHQVRLEGWILGLVPHGVIVLV